MKASRNTTSRHCGDNARRRRLAADARELETGDGGASKPPAVVVTDGGEYGRQAERGELGGCGEGDSEGFRDGCGMLDGLRRKERWFRLLFRPVGCSEAPAFDSDGTRNGGIVREVG